MNIEMVGPEDNSLEEQKRRRVYGREEERRKNKEKVPVLEEQVKALERDSLTGALVRRAFEERAQKMMQGGRKIAIMVLDLDHFKKVNDTFGHAIGDAVLKEFGAILRENTREKEDVIGRMGGEEFAVMLDSFDMNAASSIAERIRQSLRMRDIRYQQEKGGEAVLNGEDGKPYHVTASIGVAEILENDTLESALERADKALYKAKHGGRDQVQIAA